MDKNQALRNLQEAFKHASDAGVLDDLTSDINPSEINRFCDVLWDRANKDERWVVQQSLKNYSQLPVNTARYVVEVVLNENAFDTTEECQIKEFSDEFQRALDNGYFENIRYDALRFKVVSRTVIHTAPPNYLDSPEFLNANH
jgi:hypothetical protein